MNILSLFKRSAVSVQSEHSAAPVHTRYSVRVDVGETGKQYGHITVNGTPQWFLGEVSSLQHARELAAEKVAQLQANEAEVARTWEAG